MRVDAGDGSLDALRQALRDLGLQLAKADDFWLIRRGEPVTEVPPPRGVRATASTDFHPSCTCKMGTGDDAVVDAQMKVQGLDGLRVVDASVMPRIVTANTHATTLMIAEKAADLIRGREPLAPLQLPVYRPGNA